MALAAIVAAAAAVAGSDSSHRFFKKFQRNFVDFLPISFRFSLNASTFHDASVGSTPGCSPGARVPPSEDQAGSSLRSQQFHRLPGRPEGRRRWRCQPEAPCFLPKSLFLSLSFLQLRSHFISFHLIFINLSLLRCLASTPRPLTRRMPSPQC